MAHEILQDSSKGALKHVAGLITTRYKEAFNRPFTAKTTAEFASEAECDSHLEGVSTHIYNWCKAHSKNCKSAPVVVVQPVITGIMRNYTVRSLFKADHPKRPEAMAEESVGQWLTHITAAFDTLTGEEAVELEEQALLLNSTRKEATSAPHSEYLRGKWVGMMMLEGIGINGDINVHVKSGVSRQRLHSLFWAFLESIYDWLPSEGVCSSIAAGSSAADTSIATASPEVDSTNRALSVVNSSIAAASPEGESGDFWPGKVDGSAAEVSPWMEPGPAQTSDLIDGVKTVGMGSLPEPHGQVISETGLKILAQRCVAAQSEDGPGLVTHSSLPHTLPKVHAADENVQGNDMASELSGGCSVIGELGSAVTRGQDTSMHEPVLRVYGDVGCGHGRGHGHWHGCGCGCGHGHGYGQISRHVGMINAARADVSSMGIDTLDENEGRGVESHAGTPYVRLVGLVESVVGSTQPLVIPQGVEGRPCRDCQPSSRLLGEDP
ncbi:hypothetical protein HETIRDRAFT_416635 [Heterobasidion irregulare TC 32-1]|uniref:Uncharacterized protein n=1 Tax=Heterobasidion irregulare (strain TC 32-1) TaxID=747525 RepID=W4K9K5_HETIT|nr:uncharacterized protein HETIRDRAFT_416635 [Heterobasidion irregulare TC 32-1]ETW82463.1 hypothetical protein HETIRDRAFT_416635 [Heterobasidion irregulare TC 32-1]